MAVTSGAAIRQAVQSIIDADLSLPEIRSAVMALIPVEYHRRQTHARPHGRQ
jgi:hypothetical protein